MLLTIRGTHAEQKVRDPRISSHPLAIVAANDEQIEVVSHILHIVRLQLHPVRITAARNVGRCKRLQHDAFIPTAEGAVEPVHDFHGVRLRRRCAIWLWLNHNLLREFHGVRHPIYQVGELFSPIAKGAACQARAVEPQDVKYHIAGLIASIHASHVVGKPTIFAESGVIASLLVPYHHLAVKQALLHARLEAPGKDRRERFSVPVREVVAVARPPLGLISATWARTALKVQHDALAIELVFCNILALLAQNFVHLVPPRHFLG
mmetsp:Transcript_5893/g.15533  ORF Transcript_5893/g.15533 Transcript_5893/m.15533 type:complete len:264 (-) Transcript_5893:743-1534(-)